jgi:hypothetical protein
MSENVIQCGTHGEGQKAFVCSHLLGHSADLGFNRNSPTSDNPFPDAWCYDCEVVRAAHGGWNEDSEKLVHISLLCSLCYGQARIRNTRPDVKLKDFADLRWKCGSCDEWHTGLCLDFGYDSPHYWRNEYGKAIDDIDKNNRPATFLTEDLCVIEDKDFFVRGIINIPIFGTAEEFRWGVWGSLSRENFETLLAMNDDPARKELQPMFSWLSTDISDYPETLNIKMYVHIQPPGLRPTFELQPSDHPLSQEYCNGITPTRIHEIMQGRFSDLQK